MQATEVGVLLPPRLALLQRRDASHCPWIVASGSAWESEADCCKAHQCVVYPSLCWQKSPTANGRCFRDAQDSNRCAWLLLTVVSDHAHKRMYEVQSLEHRTSKVELIL